MNRDQLIKYCEDKIKRYDISKQGLEAVLPSPLLENYDWSQMKIANMHGEFSGMVASYREMLKKLEGME